MTDYENMTREQGLLNEDDEPIREVSEATRKAWEPRRSGYSREDFERDRSTREQFMRPVSQGGMSMGEGRKMEPQVRDGRVVNGTIYLGCPNSPDGLHHFTCYANLNSVEFFHCDYCSKEFSD